MKLSRPSFLISLIIHILAALIFIQIHTEGRIRHGYSAIPVMFKVETPAPRIDKPEKPRFKIENIQPVQRANTRVQPRRFMRIDQKMVTTAAYRDVVVSEYTGVLPNVEVPQGDLQANGTFDFRSRGMGAGSNIRGGKNQLVEFVDKSKGKRNVVYCLDVSASMGAANKLNLARNYMKDSLLALDSEKDVFNIIAFDKVIRVFRPGTMVTVTRENLDAAMAFMDHYTPQSIMENTKTDLLSALIQALEMKPNVIAIVTDGLPTAGITQPEKILQGIAEKNPGGKIRIFAIGMEMDLEQPEAWLMKAIAEQNSGEFQLF